MQYFFSRIAILGILVAGMSLTGDLDWLRHKADQFSHGQSPRVESIHNSDVSRLPNPQPEASPAYHKHSLSQNVNAIDLNSVSPGTRLVIAVGTHTIFIDMINPAIGEAFTSIDGSGENPRRSIVVARDPLDSARSFTKEVHTQGRLTVGGAIAISSLQNPRSSTAHEPQIFGPVRSLSIER